MNFEDFKNLDENSAFEAASAISGIDPQVLRGLIKQESGGNGSAVSRAGARGWAQIMPDTQARLEKKLGIKADVTKLNDSLFLAAHHLADDMARENGDVASALRAYNNGPNWRDKADPTGENAAYVQNIMRKAGVQIEGVQKAADTFASKIHFDKYNVQAAQMPDYSTKTPDVWDSSVDTLVAHAVQQKALDDNTGLLDKARAFVGSGQGVIGAAVHHLVDPEFGPDAVPGYSPPAEQLQGYTADELDQLQAARSPREFAYRQWQVQDTRDQMAILGRGNKVTTFLAGMVADAPAQLLLGQGVGTAMQAVGLGARVAAAGGNTVRAIGLNALEQGTAGAVSSGIEAALGGRVSATDFTMDVVGGVLLGTPLDTPGLLRSSRMASIRESALREAEQAVKLKKQFDDQAIQNLGADAHPDAIAAEAKRLEFQHLQDLQSRATGHAENAQSRLSTDYEKFLADELAAEKAPPTSGEAIQFDVHGAGAGKITDANMMHPADVEALGPGVHVDPGLTNHPRLNFAVQAVKDLVGQFLPNTPVRVHVSTDTGSYGHISSAHGINGYDIGIVPVPADGDFRKSVMTAVHEVGHALEFSYLSRMPHEIQAGVERAYQRFIGALQDGKLEEALGMRQRTTAREVGATTDPFNDPKYLKSKQEFMAEQFAKYVEEDVANQGGNVKLDSGVMAAIKSLVKKAIELFTAAKEKNYLPPEAELRDFFEAIRSGNVKPGAADHSGVKIPGMPNKGPDVSFLQDPIAIKYGLDKMPVDTPGRRAEARAIIEMYRRADDPKAAWNNIPKEKLNPLTAKFDWAVSTSLAMLRSENPVTRMVASELLESTTGAGGREATAALTKYLTEGKLLGNINNDYLRVYEAYRNRVGGNVAKDFWGGEMKRKFDREVAIEIERRQNPEYQGSADPDIKRAADAMEAAFERNRQAQISAKTTGWAALPETSRGYMPHSLSPEKVRNATKAQLDALHSALVDQFLSIEGWDFAFSQNLASKYIDRVRQRALGGYESSMNHHSVGAADIVEDALNAMNMGQDEVRAMMQRYMRGAAGHTKKRLNLDLLREYGDGDGKFQLIDLYDTDMLNLMKQQAQRVSGEVALAKYGIMGRPGLKLVRHAMGFGHNGAKATLPELEAFDQVAAEFLGDPFGNYGGKWMNRAIQFNSLARLGGMGITQAAETINAATILGVGHALAMIPNFARLRAEAAALAKGQRVGNGLLDSLELHGGREFGADAYKMVFPFDNPGMNYAVSGQQTNELADRLLRGGLHAQGKLSFWRAIHAAQNRGMAEQIVLKALRYIREGKEDIALNDMGFTKEVRDAIKAEYGNIVKLDGDKVREFDITKMENKDAADAFVQAVHRGASQIIQGTFIGETGKWAHSGWLRLMTQFRTFSLVAVEKQWARTRANFGVAKALGMLVGSMSAAAPIYMARVYAQSIGRADQNEYLQKRLSPEAIARATLNYVALSGVSGDLMDALGSVAGFSTSGGRVGSGTDFVGGVVAPAASTIDEVYKSLQNTKDGTDVYGVVKNLPFSNMPYLVPVVNMLKS